MVISVGPHVVPDVALKRLATNVALVKLFVLMERQDVSFQCVGPGVSLVAEVALVLPCARVELGVRLEVPGGGEAQRALGARVRLVPGVRPPVHHQLAAAGEPLAAVLARVPAIKQMR